MGDAETRAAYRDVLLRYWREHASLLGAEIERAPRRTRCASSTPSATTGRT